MDPVISIARRLASCSTREDIIKSLSKRIGGLRWAQSHCDEAAEYDWLTGEIERLEARLTQR